MTLAPEFKFIFVAGCLGVAIVSGLRCVSRRDWLCLVGGLGFTVLADWFLVLRHEHLLGVAAFCFAHVCYIARVVQADCKERSAYGTFPLPSAGIAEQFLAIQKKREDSWRRLCWVAAFVGFLVLWCVAVFTGNVVFMAGIYAVLFVINIFVNIKARRPKANYYLVLAGLVLFALCDLNVMLFNLPRYMGVARDFSSVFTLIWVFYLPSQVLLAVSALRFGEKPSALSAKN